MDKEKIISFFQTHYPEIKGVLLDYAIWRDFSPYDSPDKEVCKTLGRGLIALAKSGEKRAAALYCLIAFYQPSDYGFSKDIAAQLVLEMDAVDIYHELLEEQLIDIVDEDYYESAYAFPLLHIFEALATEEPKTDPDKKED